MNAPFDTSTAIGPDAKRQPAPEHQVAVIGLGYIGLPTAAVLASYGWDVCGVDVSEEVVETVNGGGVHIEERDLDRLVSEAIETGRLTASTKVPRCPANMAKPIAPIPQPTVAIFEAKR